MKKLEIILIIGSLIGFLMALFSLPLNSLIMSVFFSALGLLYFYLGFALFNGVRFRSIFKVDSYIGLGTWRILIAIGTGIALSTLTMGFMFFKLSYPLTKTFLEVGIVEVMIIIILALIKYVQGKNLFYRNIILRCMIFLIIAVVFLLLPGHLFERP